MTPTIRAFARKALWALPVCAVMLFSSTLTHQPDPQTSFGDFAAYVTTDAFLISHLVNSILGGAIGIIGAVALMLYLSDTRAAGKAAAGMTALVIGNTLSTSVFGAAAFAQRGVGLAFQGGAQNAQEIYNLIYDAPLFGTAVIGMLAFIVGGIYLGIAISRSGRFPRWAGWMFAVGLAGFIVGNIFFWAAGSVMAVVLSIASLVVAWTASRQSAVQEDRSAAAVY